MGTQTVSPLIAEAPGSTLNKLTRYARFLNEGADVDPLGVNRTFYEQSFADGFRPELLFLVQSAARERTVSEAMEPALSAWQQANPGKAGPCGRVLSLRPSLGAGASRSRVTAGNFLPALRAARELLPPELPRGALWHLRCLALVGAACARSIACAACELARALAALPGRVAAVPTRGPSTSRFAQRTPRLAGRRCGPRAAARSGTFGARRAPRLARA